MKTFITIWLAVCAIGIIWNLGDLGLWMVNQPSSLFVVGGVGVLATTLYITVPIIRFFIRRYE